MQFVAFFRNLNQGQRNSPTTATLVEAFVTGGASEVRPFQTNGTVQFDAPHPERCVTDALAYLRGNSSWHDVAFLRSRQWLFDLIGEWESPQDGEDRRCELSLFNETVAVDPVLPVTGRRCRVLTIGPGYAVSLNERDQETNATPMLERAFGVPVTSRGLGTVRRLLATA